MTATYNFGMPSSSSFATQGLPSTAMNLGLDAVTPPASSVGNGLNTSAFNLSDMGSLGLADKYSGFGLTAPTGFGADAKSKPSFMSDLFKDEHMMGNITGLAGTVMQALALPEMLKSARLQNKSLQHNLDTAKAEQARRNKNIASFNNTSAFAG